MVTATINGPSPGIRMDGLYKSFGSVQAVRGVDITIVDGETVAILGPNGAGLEEAFLELTGDHQEVKEEEISR